MRHGGGERQSIGMIGLKRAMKTNDLAPALLATAENIQTHFLAA
jgi:hypothetical protein